MEEDTSEAAWITIQLGQEANCVGAQFWNARYLSQNGPNESPLFRETRDATAVARLVSLDGEPLKKDRDTAQQYSESFPWLGPLQKIRRSSGWSKNSNTFPSCICNFDSHSLIKPPSAVQTLQQFSQGVDCYKEKLGEEFLERIRRELEFCDRLGGFQWVVDSFSGLGGFASELAYGMKDEFQCKVPLVLFGCGSYSRYSPSALNEAKLLVSLVDNNIHYIPLHSWKVFSCNRTQDIWLDWALEKCPVHDRNCTLSAVAMDCFYSLFIARSAAFLRNHMSWISMLPIVSSKEQWNWKTLISQGFRERRSPPLYTIDWISQQQQQLYKDNKMNYTDATAMWIIRCANDNISKTYQDVSSSLRQVLLQDAQIDEELHIRVEPGGFRRVVVDNSKTLEEADSCPVLFREAPPLEYIGEWICNSVWTSQYYDKAIVALKKSKKYFHSVDIDDEIEHMIYAKENLQQ